MLPLAIQCLEDELARSLSRVDRLTQELNELRRLHAAPPARNPGDGHPPPVEMPDPHAGLPPEVSRPPRQRQGAGPSSTHGPAPANVSVLVPGGASTDTLRHTCAHCSRSFNSQRGLSKHINSAHPITHRKFNPEQARAGAAAAL